jgi:hypothetical protein
MPWRPGESGNPATKFQKGHAPISPGRPIGIVRLVREMTNNGEDCVRLMCQVMTGTLPRLALGDRRGTRALAESRSGPAARQGRRRLAGGVRPPAYEPVTVRDRLAAAKWLIDRGFGKVPLTFELTQRPPTPVPLEELTDEELAQFMALLTFAKQRRHARVIESRAQTLLDDAE